MIHGISKIIVLNKRMKCRGIFAPVADCSTEIKKVDYVVHTVFEKERKRNNILVIVSITVPSRLELNIYFAVKYFTVSH